MPQKFTSFLRCGLASGLLLFSAPAADAQPPDGQSVAEYWNHATVLAISRDFARPTVHARNLFHTTIAMYDAWAAYDHAAEPYLLGRTLGAYTSPYNGVAIPSDASDVEAAREEAISFAVYRLLRHRFLNSPGSFLTLADVNQRMDQLGYNRMNTSTDYVNGGPAELGNYIAQQIINFGFTDGSNESADYANTLYEPVNPNILPEEPGTGGIEDPNRWQAISLSVSIDQSGNVVSDPPFLSPEWGNVLPFSMNDDDITVRERDGINWNVYKDPGYPSLLDTTDASGLESLWKWNFIMVSVWQSHLDPDDETVIDASPASIGNNTVYPENFEDYHTFYDFFDGGTADPGHEINPVTGAPYEPQTVKLGDYGRIVAEFWADGPSSATPPGHWFEIYNEIRHHPMWENKWMGEGPELNALEYDVKAYFTLGGAMHDAAVAAWSIKGYYDYVRPVSAIRFMCEKGQCSDPSAPNFHPAGVPIVPGYVEQVEAGDPLAGPDGEHIGKIKLYTWRGPDYIADPEQDYAGVGWILGENWWPYQRPSFVTPPFAGYVSGHSTYSRTAAEVFTLMTGSEFFPGGMSNFEAAQNEFLEFEIGPSETLYLQWATYRDASDQCSLSRIWGGIHPAIDDIPGRLIGMELGPQAFNHANDIFNSDRPVVNAVTSTKPMVNIEDIGTEFSVSISYDRDMNTQVTPLVAFLVEDPLIQNALSVTDVGWISDDTYQISYLVEETETELKDVFMRIRSALDQNNRFQNVYLKDRPFIIDTKRPEMLSATANTALLNASHTETGIVLTLTFNEPCQTDAAPEISLLSEEDLSGTLVLNTAASGWISETTYEAHYSLTDNNEEIFGIGVEIGGVHDLAGNEMMLTSSEELFDIDTRNPELLELTPSAEILNTSSVGSGALTLTAVFDKPMNQSLSPQFGFPEGVSDVLVLNTFQTGWADPFTFTATYNQNDAVTEIFDIQAELISFFDMSGNPPSTVEMPDVFSVDTRRPEVESLSPQSAVIADIDAEAGTWTAEITFDEAMDGDQLLLVQLQGAEGISPSLTYNPFLSDWIDEVTYAAVFNVTDQNTEIEGITLAVSFGKDLAGNDQVPHSQTDYIDIDTRNPEVSVLLANVYTVTETQAGQGGFSLLVLFDEAMNTDESPVYSFGAEESGLAEILAPNAEMSSWENSFTYHGFYDVTAQADANIPDVEVALSNAFDLAGNAAVPAVMPNFFSVEMGSLSADALPALGGIALYPNPVAQGDVLRLSTKDDIGTATFSLLDMQGKLLMQKVIPHLYEGEHYITPPKLAPGVYFGNLTSAEGNVTFKLVSTN